MKQNVVLVSLVIGAALLALAAAAPDKSDTAALQGTWQGHEVGRNDTGQCRLVVSGNSLHFRGADTNEWCKMTFTLKPETTPKQFTGTMTDCCVPNYVGKECHGIYRIENGKLTIAGAEPGTPNVPASFDAPDARQFVFEKVKTAKP
jgi:uncharacterized protein (TIGR03067 family)